MPTNEFSQGIDQANKWI